MQHRSALRRDQGLARVALYFAAAVIFATIYLTHPMLPLLSAEFGVAPATTGLSVSVAVLMIALGATWRISPTRNV